MIWEQILRIAEVTHLVLVALLLVQYLFIYRLLRWHPALMYGVLLLAVWLATLLHVLRPAYPQGLAEGLAIFAAAGTATGPFSRRRLALTMAGIAGAGLLAALLPAAWWRMGDLAALLLLLAAARRCRNDQGIYRALGVTALLLAGGSVFPLLWGLDPWVALAEALLRTVAYTGLMLGAYHAMLQTHRGTANALWASGMDMGTLMGSLDEVIYVMDPEGTLLYVSDAIRRYGILPNELWGRTWSEVTDPEPPPPPIDEELRLPVFGLRHRGTGTLHWLEESSRLAQVTGRWLAIGTLRDVTQRIVLERRLLASARMAAVGELSSGIAHNFNNLLAGISVRVEHLLLLASHTGDERLQHGLEAILANTRRGADITRKLLTFARGGPVNLETVPLALPVQEALEVMSPERLPALEMQVDVPPALHAFADEGHLQQVLVNLILNAVQAMPTGGTLRIQGRTQGDRVHLVVQDTGPGIPPEHLSRIFEPFFTTKRESSQGTGLGLSVSLGMLRAMGGDLLVESRVGHGSTFTVVLQSAP